MIKTTVTITCDVCKGDSNIKSIGKLQVIQTTEQTEGRNCTPYLSEKSIDLCDKCYSRILSGHYLFAAGAMGYNDYWFKN